MKSLIRGARTGYAGNTKAEYLLIFALVTVVAIAALSGLGGSISGLLGMVSQGTGGSGEAGKVMGLLDPVQKSPASVSLDPGSGLPIVPYGDASSPATNATSIPGNQNNEVGAFRLASTLSDLAKLADDPDKAAKLDKLAKLVYYMGGAEGAVKGVPALSIPEQVTVKKKTETLFGFIPIGEKKTKTVTDKYTSGAAVRDISTYQQQIQQEVASFQADMGDPVDVTAMAVVQDAVKISGNFIKTVDTSKDPPFNELTYDQRVAYDTMQQKADTVLTDNVVESIPVEVTLKDAVMTKKLAEKKKAKLAATN